MIFKFEPSLFPTNLELEPSFFQTYFKFELEPNLFQTYFKLELNLSQTLPQI
jgi:hypothetical protein